MKWEINEFTDMTSHFIKQAWVLAMATAKRWQYKQITNH